VRTEPTKQAAGPARAPRAARFLLVPVLLLGVLGPARAEDPPAGQVEVHLTEYAIQIPATVVAGPTTFVVHNDGEKTHSFKIEGPGLAELLATPVKPQETEKLQVTLQAGDYKVYCPIGSHEGKGMVKKLTVTAKPAG
jgi:plastocyanin